MKLIPAIDLKDGLVVHAQGGDRANYRPLHTPLFPDADPADVVGRILSASDCDTVYLADLDAITGRGHNQAAVAAIRRRHPAPELWLDAGIRTPRDLDKIEIRERLVPVVGTETLATDVNSFSEVDYILSLDFGIGKPPGGGAGGIAERIGDWPKTVIALSLAAVGTTRGPDCERLHKLRAQYRGRLIAGGGVGGADDLETLRAMRIDGALVATAIYRGTLPQRKKEI